MKIEEGMVQEGGGGTRIQTNRHHQTPRTKKRKDEEGVKTRQRKKEGLKGERTSQKEKNNKE